MKKKVLDKRTIAAIRRRRFMMLADNGGERPTPPEPEPTDWNMRVVANPTEGHSMPTTTGNFTLVEQRDDVYYYIHNGSISTGNGVLSDSNYVVSDVTFKDCEHIRTISWLFLSHLHSKTIDLSPFRNVTSIEGGFLNYNDFEYIDLSPLSNIVNVGYQRTNYGNGFLAYSKSLKSIDITPLQGVKNIGERFLAGCESLVSVTLPTFNDLENKTTILYGFNYFLYNCKSLVGDITINAPKLEKIGNDFLSGCAMVDSVTINAPKINSIGNNFLSGCRNITSIKVPWTTIPTTATDGFMVNAPTSCSIEVPCEAVSAYKSTSPWSNRANYINGGEGCEEPEPEWNMKVVAHPDSGYSMPETTGYFTLTEQNGDTYYYKHNGSSTTGGNVLYKSNTSSHWNVTDVTFKDCEHITSITTNFLYQCNKLTSLDLSPLSNVTRIADYFLYQCSKLTSLDLSPLSNVASYIGNYFLYGCSGLTSLDLSPLQNVPSIGQSFLRNCSGLTSLDISPLQNVTHTDKYFLAQCSGLTSLDLTPLSNIESIGTYFLYNCKTLTSLKLPWATIPTTATDGFMSKVPSTCTIEVPCEAVDTYKTTSPWSNRASYIVGDC